MNVWGQGGPCRIPLPGAPPPPPHPRLPWWKGETHTADLLSEQPTFAAPPSALAGLVALTV